MNNTGKDFHRKILIQEQKDISVILNKITLVFFLFFYFEQNATSLL